MQEELRNALSTINTTVEDHGSKLEAMQGTVSKLEGLTQSMSTTVAQLPSPDVFEAALTPAVERLATRLATRVEEAFKPSDVASLEASISKVNNQLIHVEAVNTNRKVVEKEGKLSLEDKTWWDHTKDYAKPIAIGAAATVAGIGLYEGGRWAFDKAFGDDEPVID